MTDKERAEEYILSLELEKGNKILQLKEVIKVIYKAHLDGLAEGKPKWHEIKCCSQDLPSRSKDNYLHSVIVSNEYGEPIYYNYNIDEWCDMEGDVVSDSYKYWCELPQFKE